MFEVMVYSPRGLNYEGRDLERGEVFKLTGAINDHLLQSSGYVRPWYEGTRCGECGKLFHDDYLLMHKARHRAV
jgi:hypothetical protein